MATTEITPDQRNRLQRLAHGLLGRTPPPLSQTQGRQVRMIAALIEGRTGKQIASQLGVKPSSVSNLKKELQRLGLEHFLQKWEDAIVTASAALAKKPGKPGPKGVESIDEWLQKRSIDTEPVFELVCLMIGPGANIAVFAVRDRKAECLEDMVGAQSFTATVRAVMKEPILPALHWTKVSVFDVCVSELLADLRAKFVALEKSGMSFRWCDGGPDLLAELRKHYAADHEFFILVQGEVGERTIELGGQLQKEEGDGSRPATVFPIPSATEFFARLASTIYRLRERWSCAGFLPLFWILRAEVRHWAKSGENEPLIYQIEGGPNDLETGLAHRALLWRYTAIHGALFHMNRSMWSRLPWNDHFRLEIASIPPRILVSRKPGVECGIVVDLQLIQQRAYTREYFSRVPSRIDISCLQRTLQKRLSDRKAKVEFFYSIAPGDTGVWDQMIYPGDGHQIPEALSPVHARLIPRHFVATQDPLPIPLEELRTAAEGLKEGISRQAYFLEGERKFRLVFHVPRLVTNIRKAYERNVYGDQISEMERFLSDMARYFAQAKPDGPWKRIGVVGIHFYRPSYWCLDPATSGLESEDGWRWNQLLAKQKFANEQGIAFDFIPRGGDFRESGFKDVLRDLDADFLWCHLAPEDRKMVDRMARVWAVRIKARLKRRYDVTVRKGRGLVISAASPVVRTWAAAVERKSELYECVRKALDGFSRNEHRVVRRAIEIAQRCSLAGLEPVALVVESEDSIRARWHRYLKGKLAADFTPREGSKAGKGESSKSKSQGRKKKTKAGESDNPQNPDVDKVSESDAGSTYDSNDGESSGIQELLELILGLAKSPRNSNLAKGFADEAAGADRHIWAGALELLDEQSNGAAIKAAVLDGLKLCRGKAGGAASRESKSGALMERFAKLGEQA